MGLCSDSCCCSCRGAAHAGARPQARRTRSMHAQCTLNARSMHARCTRAARAPRAARAASQDAGAVPRPALRGLSMTDNSCTAAAGYGAVGWIALPALSSHCAPARQRCCLACCSIATPESDPPPSGRTLEPQPHNYGCISGACLSYARPARSAHCAIASRGLFLSCSGLPRPGRGPAAGLRWAGLARPCRWLSRCGCRACTPSTSPVLSVHCARPVTLHRHGALGHRHGGARSLARPRRAVRTAAAALARAPCHSSRARSARRARKRARLPDMLGRHGELDQSGTTELARPRLGLLLGRGSSYLSPRAARSTRTQARDAASPDGPSRRVAPRASDQSGTTKRWTAPLARPAALARAPCRGQS